MRGWVCVRAGVRAVEGIWRNDGKWTENKMENVEDGCKTEGRCLENGCVYVCK